MATTKVPDHMSSWPDLPMALMLVSAEDAYTQPRPSIKNSLRIWSTPGVIQRNGFWSFVMGGK